MATVVWRLRRAQWNTGSITHIHPASPARVHLLKNWGEKNEKRKDARALSLSLGLNHACHELLRFRRLHVSGPRHTVGLCAGGCCSSRLRLSVFLSGSKLRRFLLEKKKERDLRPQLVRNLSFTPRDPSHTDLSPSPLSSSGWTEEVKLTLRCSPGRGRGGSAAAAVRGAEGARTYSRTQTRTHSLQGPFEQLCLLHVGFLFLLKENSAGAEMKN